MNDEIHVYVLKCACGFVVSTLSTPNEERAKAGMMEHLVYAHSEAHLNSSDESSILNAD